jgi:predicted nuclease of predicted toxin-antitoxin system
VKPTNAPGDRRGAGKPDGLLLDEMFSPAIVDELAAGGVDCRAVAADRLLRALSDLEIFEAALLEDRVIVTNNVADFESLRRAREAAGGQVPGLIYTSDLSFPRTRAYVSRLVTALETAAVGHAAGSRGGVLWLRPPPDPAG